MDSLDLINSRFVFAEALKVEQQAPSGPEAILEDATFKEAIKPFNVDVKIRTADDGSKNLFLTFNKLGTSVTLTANNNGRSANYFPSDLMTEIGVFDNIKSIQYQDLGVIVTITLMDVDDNKVTLAFKIRELTSEEKDL